MEDDFSLMKLNSSAHNMFGALLFKRPAICIDLFENRHLRYTDSVGYSGLSSRIDFTLVSFSHDAKLPICVLLGVC